MSSVMCKDCTNRSKMKTKYWKHAKEAASVAREIRFNISGQRPVIRSGNQKREGGKETDKAKGNIIDRIRLGLL